MLIKNTTGAILSFINNSPISGEDKNRLKQFSVFVTLAIPVMTGFVIFNFLNGHYLLCSITLLSGLCLIGGWYLLGKVKNGDPIYRFNMFCYCSLILYMFISGGESGSMLLWGYTVPLVSFFLFGTREGTFWSGLVLLSSVIVYLNPLGWQSVYPHNEQMMLRYIVTYVVVSTTAYWFEYLRQHYRKGMEKKQELLIKQMQERLKAEKEKEKLISKLQEALADVEQLQQFLPICASCRKIRDDHGYWDQLESYLAKHADLKFSHSICPDCVKMLYPNITISNEKQGGRKKDHGAKRP